MTLPRPLRALWCRVVGHRYVFSCAADASTAPSLIPHECRRCGFKRGVWVRLVTPLDEHEITYIYASEKQA